MRIKRGVNAVKKRRKILKLAKGYFGAKSKNYRIARQAVMKSFRKVLADIAVNDAQSFAKLVETAKASL